MKTIIPAAELPVFLRGNRRPDEFVAITVEDAPTPSDTEKLAYLRAAIDEGDRAIAEGRASPAEDVFSRLREVLKERFSL